MFPRMRSRRKSRRTAASKRFTEPPPGTSRKRQGLSNRLLTLLPVSEAVPRRLSALQVGEKARSIFKRVPSKRGIKLMILSVDPVKTSVHERRPPHEGAAYRSHADRCRLPSRATAEMLNVSPRSMTSTSFIASAG